MKKKVLRKKKKFHKKLHHHIINHPWVSLFIFIIFVITAVLGSRVFAAKPTQPTGQFDLITVDNNGTHADTGGQIVDMTKDGQILLFSSNANNLGITDGKYQLFVRDRTTNTTEMISILPDGNRYPNNMSRGFLSADGRYVSFADSSTIYKRDRQTGTTTIVASFGNRGVLDMTSDSRYYLFMNPFPGRQNPFTIYLYDSQTNAFESVTVNSNGDFADYTGGDINQGVISDDGRYIIFNSSASNLAPNDTNNVRDLFIRDRQNGTTSFLYGNETPGGDAYISSTGRFVLFGTPKALVSQDKNDRGDYYLLDRQTDTVDLVTITSHGKQTTDLVSGGKVSDDGRYVVFSTQSTNFNPYNSTWLVAYLRDRETEKTELIGQDPFCKHALFSFDSFVSNDGQFVAFNTPDRASELDVNDNSVDGYLRDRTIPFGHLPKNCQ